jgi:hypothetical protein
VAFRRRKPRTFSEIDRRIVELAFSTLETPLPIPHAYANRFGNVVKRETP